MRERTARRSLGRGFNALLAGSLVSIVGALVAGLVADLGNVRMAFAVGAAVLAASAALMWRALGELDSASRPAEQ